MNNNDDIFDVAAIGNALVDIIAETDDAFLQQEGIAKNVMTLVSPGRAAELHGKISGNVKISSGGSAANTMAGIASLGGKPAFLGKVKGDQLGEIFRNDMRAEGVHFGSTPVPDHNTQHAGASTGRCIIFVTPDAKRSMNTDLGVSVDFEGEDVNTDILQRSKITYLEGYLFDRPAAKEAFYHAAAIVKAAGKKLAMTLSDTFCVNRHRDEFLAFIESDVDILFGNEEEILALYQTKDLDAALAALRQHTPIAVITRGARGAVIASGDQTYDVPAVPVDHVIDTTGAGDQFAAGVLYGLTHGKSLPEAGHIGAIAASEVISHYGPRPQVPLKQLLVTTL